MPYSLTDEYLWKEVKGRVVILHFDSGRYYSLNSTGSLIWENLLDDLSLDEIADQVCSAFDVDRQVAKKDTEKIINDFLAKKIIKNV